MKITAISGWAIPSDWFSEQIGKYFKNSEINVIYPNNPFDSEEARIKINAETADLYLGYSLGSLWMFKHKNYFPTSSIKAVLAPILGFTKEHNMGGKTTATQLNYLIKLLKPFNCKILAHDILNFKEFYEKKIDQFKNQ